MVKESKHNTKQSNQIRSEQRKIKEQRGTIKQSENN